MTAVQRALVLLAIGALIGWAVCDRLHRGAVVPHTPTDEVRLADGTVQVARVPGGQLTMPAPTLPKKSKRVAAVELKLQGPAPVQKPTPLADNFSAPPGPVCLGPGDFICPPVKLRLDVGELAGQYVIAARSDDGEVLAATHVPFRTLPASKRNSIAVLGNSGGDFAAAYSRQVTPRLSGAVGAWKIGDESAAGGGVVWRY